MALYVVKQTLAKTLTIEVEAKNAEEARQLARDGHGEVVEEDRKLGLLCDEAKRVSS